jgi:hypothetical protein
MNDREKLFKSALLLGIASGGLRAIYWTNLDDENAESALYESMDGLIKKLDDGIFELFYKSENSTNEPNVPNVPRI